MSEEQPLIRKMPCRFEGDSLEYFRIWIVNIFLTIVTLGIYSAWAKVRTLRYFYGNTWLDNNSFSYLANPLQILKGRNHCRHCINYLFLYLGNISASWFLVSCARCFIISSHYGYGIKLSYE